MKMKTLMGHHTTFVELPFPKTADFHRSDGDQNRR